jgi:hypothetical protein
MGNEIASIDYLNPLSYDFKNCAEILVTASAEGTGRTHVAGNAG